MFLMHVIRKGLGPRPRFSPLNVGILLVFSLSALAHGGAQASSVLVGNLGETIDGLRPAMHSPWLAAPFVTDSNTNTLEYVTLKLTPSQFPSPTLSYARVYEADAGGMPGAVIGELTNPTMPYGVLGECIFTAASAIALTPSTRYLVAIGSQTGPATPDQRANWHYSSSPTSSGPGSMPGTLYYSLDQGGTWSVYVQDAYPLFEVGVQQIETTIVRKEFPVSFNASSSLFFKADLVNANMPDEMLAITLPTGKQVLQRTSDGAIVQATDKNGASTELTAEELEMVEKLGVDTGWIPGGSPIQIRILFNASEGNVSVSEAGTLVLEYDESDVGPGMELPVTLSWIADPGQGTVHMDGGLIFSSQYKVGLTLSYDMPWPVPDVNWTIGGQGNLPGVPQADLGWDVGAGFQPFVLEESVALADDIGGTSFMFGPDIGVGSLQIGADITGDAYGRLTGQSLCLDLGGENICILTNGERVVRTVSLSSETAATGLSIAQDYDAAYRFDLVSHVTPNGCVDVGICPVCVGTCITDFVSVPDVDVPIATNMNVPLNFGTEVTDVVIDGVLPEITSTDPPAQASEGQDITILGNHFGLVQGSVFCGTVPAAVTSWSQTQIVATIPVGAESGLCVETVAGRSATFDFQNPTAAPDRDPMVHALYANYPNPFNPNTTIRFDLPAVEAVNLRIYGVTGRLVRNLIDNQMMTAGKQAEVWNGRDDLGRSVSSGIYFYELKTASFSATRSMTLLK